MAQEGKEEVSALLARFSLLITYRPLNDEVDFRSLGILQASTSIYELPADAAANPADALSKVPRTHDAAVMLPGQRFDAQGTRHGRGGGWYDRFLAEAPAEWLRIGLCFDEQFSQSSLLREPWDQPVDYLIVVSKEDGSMALRETGARGLVS